MKRPPLAPLAKSTERLLIMGLILSGWAFIVVMRLLQLQVFGHDRYVRLGDFQQERLEPIEAPRGAIMDRDGNYLAISCASQVAVVNPLRIPNKDLAAAILARILNVDADTLQNDLDSAAASRHHRGYFVVDRNITPKQAETLRALKLDWLEIRRGSIRTYPNGQLAAHVIGDVNSEGKGSAGVELKLDKELRGTPGTMLVKMDVHQRPYASQIEKSAIMGKTMGLTIDSQLQHVAEQSLRSAVVDNHAAHGSVVAIDPETGEILALANYPTYDLSKKLHVGEKPHGREDLAVVAPYEPGSVFKVITLAAALETTRLKPSTIIPCAGGVMKIFGRTVHDAENHGDLSMADVLAMSSNVGAIRIGMEVGSQNLYDYVRRFGIGSRTGIELPAEAPGMLRRLSRWQPTSLPSVAFGHEVSVTTVQLARMGSVIANGGYLVHPHIVAWEQAPGEPKQYSTFERPVRVLRPDTVETMRDMMERVVTSPHGTGHHLHLVGYSLAGKTGTAQIFDFAHHVYTHKYNASFMGFAPVNNPSVLVVVTVSGTTGTAGFGSTASGPAFDAVTTEALRLRGVRRDVPEEIEELEQKELAEKEKLKSKDRKGQSSRDEDTVAALATPLTPEEARTAVGDREESGHINQNLAGPTVPNFVGKTVQSVVEEATRDGVEVDMLGQGMARAQNPPAGVLMNPGEHILVRFAR